MKGMQPDPNALLLCSSDYLCLSTDPVIIRAQVEALKTQGHGILRSDVYRSGNDDLQQFEQGLAELMGAEEVVTCQSGWNANVGLIQAIAGEEVPIYLDMYSHTSLWEGARSAGGKVRAFKHNDPNSLERMVGKYGPGLVAVDAVYSTSGAIAPLKDLVSVCEKSGCALIVDESHSLGVFGERGEGLTASLGLASRVHFRTSSLSKAFAARGGIVAGSSRHMQYFRYESRPAIFSSGILPHESAGFMATLSAVIQARARRERVHSNAEYLKAALTDLYYNVADSQSQIVSLVAGYEKNTLLLRDALEKRGIFGSVFCAPATAKNRSLIRFSVNAGLSTEQLDRIAWICGAIRREVRFYHWPSTRKGQKVVDRPYMKRSA